MIKEADKFINSAVMEGMTSIRAILSIQENSEILNDRKIIKILYDSERYVKLKKEIGYLTHQAKKYGFSISNASKEYIEALTLGNSHGGIIALCTDRKIPLLEDNILSIKPNGFYVMIQGIEDPYNFGYSLRSLYACGAEGIILPQRNWMSAAGVVCRASAGASELMNIYTSDALKAAEMFKNNGYKIVCADLKTSNTLGKTELKLPIFLIVGGEKRGISKELLDLSDIIVKIPYGRKFNASLSAASATTIMAYEIMRQNENYE